MTVILSTFLFLSGLQFNWSTSRLKLSYQKQKNTDFSDIFFKFTQICLKLKINNKLKSHLKMEPKEQAVLKLPMIYICAGKLRKKNF